MIELAEEPDLRKLLGTAARSRVHESFNLEKQFDKFADLYFTLAQNAR